MIHATTRRLLAVLLVLLALDAAAHPGRTAADGCWFAELVGGVTGYTSLP